MKRFSMLLVVMFVSMIASAQQYSLQSFGQVDNQCVEAKQIATWYLDQLPTNGEQVVVVCKDSDFESFRRKVGNPSQNAFSIQMKKDMPFFVYVRAGALRGDIRSNKGFTPALVLAHEYGHIVRHSSFEEIAQSWAESKAQSLKPYKQ